MSRVHFWITVALLTIGQSAAPVSGETRVAVINVPQVSDRYLKTRDLELAFEQRKAQFMEKRDALRGKIDRTARSLQEELKPGTQEYRDRSKQLSLLEAELQWVIDAQGRQIEGELASSLRGIFSDIERAVREVAQRDGIDVVLAADQLPESPPANTTQARQQIVLQKVLFWRPEVDITDKVVETLNAQYEAQKTASPGGAAAPPLQGAVDGPENVPGGIGPRGNP